MLVSLKNQYALRAIFELAKRKGKGPVKISEISEAQSIPLRFLEVILSQLKNSGFVDSKRGYHGGYTLCRSAAQVTVGDVFRFMQGPMGPVHCIDDRNRCKCPSEGDNRKCAFYPMWERIHTAIVDVYDATTIQDLLDNERRISRIVGDTDTVKDLPDKSETSQGRNHGEG